MKLLENANNFRSRNVSEGFCLGILLAISVSMLTPKAKAEIIKVPVVEKTIIVKQPVYVNANDRHQIQCLAENAYFEAGNQSTKGMIAVTNVVMNRAKDKRFPSTPCAVVHQKARGICQFSWVCGKKNIRDWALFERTKKVAEHVYLGNYGDVTHGAKFYHANYVNPNWGFTRVAQIGSHVFYKG